MEGTNTNRSIILYTYTYACMHAEHVSKSGTVEEMKKEKRKRRKNDRVNNTKTYRICIGIRHNKTH
jgi:hypothetical protein